MLDLYILGGDDAVDAGPEEDEQDGKDDVPLPPPEDVQVVARFHVGAKGHRVLFSVDRCRFSPAVTPRNGGIPRQVRPQRTVRPIAGMHIR